MMVPSPSFNMLFGSSGIYEPSPDSPLYTYNGSIDTAGVVLHGIEVEEPNSYLPLLTQPPALLGDIVVSDPEELFSVTTSQSFFSGSAGRHHSIYFYTGDSNNIVTIDGRGRVVSGTTSSGAGTHAGRVFVLAAGQPDFSGATYPIAGGISVVADNSGGLDGKDSADGEFDFSISFDFSGATLSRWAILGVVGATGSGAELVYRITGFSRT